MNALDPAADTSPLPDEEVIARVRAGDRACFEILVRRHNQRLYRVVRGVLRDEDEVEDVMQCAYVSAFAHLDQFAGRARFSTWLCRIAVNEALLRLRRARRERVEEHPGETDMMDTSPSSARGPASPEDHTATRQLRDLLEGAVDELPATYRAVFVLREAEELSTAETAEVLALTEEAVKVRLHRARARIRDALLARVGAASAGELFRFYRPRCDRIVAGVLARIAAASGSTDEASRSPLVAWRP